MNIKAVKPSAPQVTIVQDRMGSFHSLLDDIMGVAGISSDLYAHLGHGRWTSFFKSKTAEVLKSQQADKLTPDEESQADEAIAALAQKEG